MGASVKATIAVACIPVALGGAAVFGWLVPGVGIGEALAFAWIAPVVGVALYGSVLFFLGFAEFMFSESEAARRERETGREETAIERFHRRWGH